MSVHVGSETWAGKCMEHSGLDRLLHGSGNLANDEGLNINWGFWLGKELTPEEARSMLSKLLDELSTHSNVEVHLEFVRFLEERGYVVI